VELTPALLAYARRVGLHVARKVLCPALKDECVGAALVGLWRAAKAYDPAGGRDFETYAWHAIDGAARDWLLQAVGLTRTRRARGVSVPLQLEGELPARSWPVGAELEARDSFTAALCGLGFRDRLIARLYWVEDLTSAEIGRYLAISRSSVWEAIDRALSQLRAAWLQRAA
jgi:RNA polymerase sigma factor (sigma-70 family)